MYCGTVSQPNSTVRSTSIGIASTYDRNSASRSDLPGRTGASDSEQLPKITVVAPWSHEYEHSGSQVTWAS